MVFAGTFIKMFIVYNRHFYNIDSENIVFYK